MQNLTNIEKDTWIRPWMKTDFSDLTERDERFFGIIMKGLLNWLNKHIILYNRPIKHFIFNTGSSYMYIESNGYNFSWNETTGEDTMYMEMPRCIVNIGDLTIPQEELSNPFVTGIYERNSNGKIKGYNAQIRRLPIELSIHLRYVLSNFNESIILLEEILDKAVFQQYFKVIYLGQVIMCSIEWPNNSHIEINKIDMTEANVNQKTIELDLKICSSYPLINNRTEVSNEKIIGSQHFELTINKNDNKSDYQEKNIED